MILTKQQTSDFEQQGYLVIENVFSTEELMAFKHVLERIMQCVVQKAKQDHPDITDMHITNLLNQAIPELRKLDSQYPTMIQRMVNRTPNFCHLFSKPEIAEIIRQLNYYDTENPLYSVSNSLIFTDPNNPNNPNNTSPSNFELDWHNDMFSTIPYNKFTHIWAPLIYDATVENGTLLLCPGSHKELIKQDLNIQASYNHRFVVDKQHLKKFEPISVEVKLGQALFFDGGMIHRSGHNVSDHMRYTMIGLFHDALSEKFMPLATAYQYMQHTPMEYYYELFHDSDAKKVMYDELEARENIKKGSV